jgi:tetratricopeptide (TPR) repeat protein
LKPDFISALSNLGMVLYYLGAFEEGISFFKKALLSAPNNRPCQQAGDKISQHMHDHHPTIEDNKPPPASSMLLNLLPPVPAERTILDYNFFERNCA